MTKVSRFIGQSLSLETKRAVLIAAIVPCGLIAVAAYWIVQDLYRRYKGEDRSEIRSDAIPGVEE